ncbi:MAG: cytochrome c oxidase subunit II [Acidiferrobacterales bacterium]|nr:cytochrome c oxidase subunit II [Acidiferrobacterales bacterium]
MSRVFFRLRNLVRLAAGALAFLPYRAFAEWGLNLPPPSTPIADRILDLHNAIMLVCLVIFIVVFGVMFYSLYAHRKSRGHAAHQFSHNSKLEVVWTVIPFLILVGMAIPSTATLLFMEDTTESDLTVKITGYQWKWEYEYIDHDINFFSNLSTPRAQIENREPKGEHYLLEVDNPVVLPANRKIRFLLTSNDVIHAWWIPKFGVKKDAIPGYINEFWATVDEPGDYRGQCAELCGKDHGFMPIVANVMAAEDFDSWIADQQTMKVASMAEADRVWSMEELMAHGEEVYFQCIACHGDQGQGVPPTFPPLTGNAVTIGPIAEHINVVMNGRPNTTMVAFRDQLSDEDIAAVITYERNALGNSVGDLVQPSEIKALR